MNQTSPPPATPNKPDHVILLEELNALLFSLQRSEDKDSLKMKLEGLKLKKEIVEVYNDGVKHNEQIGFQKSVVQYQDRIERWRVKVQHRKDVAALRVESQTKMMIETAGFAKITLNSLLLVNGGALLAILSFLGNALKTGCQIGQIQFLIWFIVATFAAILGSGVAYITQALYSEGFRHPGFYAYASKIRIFAICIAFTSLLSFSIGSASSYNAFSENKVLSCNGLLIEDLLKDKIQ